MFYLSLLISIYLYQSLLISIYLYQSLFISFHIRIIRDIRILFVSFVLSQYNSTNFLTYFFHEKSSFSFLIKKVVGFFGISFISLKKSSSSFAKLTYSLSSGMIADSKPTTGHPKDKASKTGRLKLS
jgi:hypothetical protein